jgi:1,4-alpha-glucan branching enzyme
MNTPSVVAPAVGPPVAPAAASHTGMGAIPYPGGVTFRVWSMFADAVSVSGLFNRWTSTPMAPERVAVRLMALCPRVLSHY